MLQGFSHVRATVRAISALAVLGLLFIAVPLASGADALVEGRTLFETERFTPVGGPSNARVGATLPEDVYALAGETEAFQFVIHNTSAATLELDGSIAGLPAGVTGTLLRVASVNIPDGSSNYGTAGGTYTDPLPPLRATSSAGALSIPAGAWGGVLVSFNISAGAAAGDTPGTVELFANRGKTVYGRSGFTLHVRRASGNPLLQAGATGSFMTTLGVEANQYWLGHTAMRNGADKRFPGNVSPADRTAQLAGLYAFLNEHGITPLDLGAAGVDGAGNGTCSLNGTSFFDQARTYFANGALFSRWMPYRSTGCDIDSGADDFTAVTDPKHTASLKQDDALDARAPGFWSNVSKAWSANGLFTTRTYVKNPFDEPSDATAAQRVQMNVELPKSNIALHKAVGTKAKIVLAGWPRDERRLKACKKVGKKTPCRVYEQDLYGNRKLWDGKGADDVDVWMVPFSRMFGRVTSPWMKSFKTGGTKINRDREYINRLAAIRAKHRGGETWGYSFYTADKNTMQTTIDAPGTDARLQYLLAAREGLTGLYISNLLMGWGNPDTATKLDAVHYKNGDPYTQTPYFKHPVYGTAAGWGTYIYPGYSPQYGLTTETDRNSAAGRPVSSLRLEAMRDGQEDANLAIMYRNRFGQKKLEAQLAALFPNKPYRQQTRSLGQVVFPTYSNVDMAARMETVRRAMINELSS
ncbi:MAG: DUF4091 domain-containing protein [Thermoleophilia bacterium]|nr:DUF4091 domain-containing protein [Thermoleophilia bacterium]